MAECLCFYWGCPNINKWLHPDSYVCLDLSDFDSSFEIIKRAIDEDWWSKRIHVIRAEKIRILNELQFFPRVEKIISEKMN